MHAGLGKHDLVNRSSNAYELTNSTLRKNMKLQRIIYKNIWKILGGKVLTFLKVKVWSLGYLQ